MTVPLPDLFKRVTLAPGGVRINTLVGGNDGGSPVLLLHGYPQTHVMWHHVAPILAQNHTVVLTDLRGYGDSGKPPGGPTHEAYAKRTMARDQALVMRELGFDEFAVAYGHWFFLAQPEPLPEHQIGADPVGWVRGRMSSWRRGGQPFDPQAVDEYVRCFRDPAAIHASCEDYRAAVGTDLEDDDAAAPRS